MIFFKAAFWGIFIYTVIQSIFLGFSIGVGYLLSWLFSSLSFEFACVLGGMGNGALLLIVKMMIDSEDKTSLSYLLKNIKVPDDSVEEDTDKITILPPRPHSPRRGRRK
ncbi:hypothetical protein WDW89_01490 [Deltaproteobacteria bacterium TL4]